jgi:hypothetical protein
MNAISLTLVLAILAWTINLNLAHAYSRDYYQDLAICKGRTAQVHDRGYCSGLIACALTAATDNATEETITTGCMAELGWRTK